MATVVVFGVLTIFSTIVIVLTSSTKIDCNDGAFYIRADPKTPNHFYKCDNGTPVLFSCPEGLLYNPKIYVCDWPRNLEWQGKNGGSHFTDAGSYTSDKMPSSSYSNTGHPVTFVDRVSSNNKKPSSSYSSTGKPVTFDDRVSSNIKKPSSSYSSTGKPVTFDDRVSSNSKKPASTNGETSDDTQDSYNPGNVPWHMQSYDINNIDDFHPVQVIDNSLNDKFSE